MASEPQVGAHVISPRTGYTHHGIYVGDEKVIHYSGLATGIELGPVEEADLQVFSGSNGFTVKTYKNALPTDEVIRRARSRLGESAYSVFHNNCEHFCLWCIVGDHTSPQVDRVTWVSTPSVGTIVGLAARGVVAASGSVAGLSGAGVMSGLASAGAVVSGGAVAGIALLGGVPSAAMASLVNKTVLADNPSLESNERNSRAVGRVASYVGGGAGIVGGIAAISAAGTTAGLSAAGITSGLAAIGGAVGGGMAAGVFVVTAAPVAAAATVGYGVYKIVRWAAFKQPPPSSEQSSPLTGVVKSVDRGCREEVESEALGGSMVAALRLANMYDRGLGVDESKTRMFAWLLWGEQYGSRDDEADVREELGDMRTFYSKVISAIDKEEAEKLVMQMSAITGHRS